VTCSHLPLSPGADFNSCASPCGAQIVYSCVIVANAAMGAGMLSFPLGFKVAGYGLGVMLVIMFAMIQTFSLSVIARASRNYSAPSYEHLIGEMFGQGAKNFLMCAISVFLFLVCVAYLKVISGQVRAEPSHTPLDCPLCIADGQLVSQRLGRPPTS
jgi:hypothetical protein